jgi:hypothetical protein
MSVYSVAPIRFGSVSMVTLTRGANDPEVGTIIREGDEEYIFVYNAGNSQISKGYGATVTAVSGYSVTVSSVANEDFAVGICVHATLTTNTYGWLMKKGFANFKASADSTVTAGGRIALGTDGVWYQPTVSSNVSNLQSPVFGKVMVGTASAGTAVGYFSIY